MIEWLFIGNLVINMVNLILIECFFLLVFVNIYVGV